MRKPVLCLLVLMLGVVMGGCAAKTTTDYVSPVPKAPENSRVYDAPVEKVWRAVVKSVSEKFFVLDHIEKDSHILSLSFSAQNPDEYIDCGTITHTNSGGMSGQETITFAGAAPYTRFLAATDGTPHPKMAERKTKLDGKMNIILAEEGKNKTRVTVNARYVMSMSFTSSAFVPSRWGGYFTPVRRTGSVSFNTGQIGTIDTGSRTECVTRYTLEKMVLDGIQSGLQ